PAGDAAPNFKNITKSFTTLMNNVTRSDSADNAAPVDSDPFATEDVSIRVEPFAAVTTKVKTFEKSNKERLRLTIEAEGERHQVQAPVPTSESAAMKPLAD